MAHADDTAPAAAKPVRWGQGESSSAAPRVQPSGTDPQTERAPARPSETWERLVAYRERERVDWSPWLRRLASSHLEELQASGVADDVTAVNISSFGPGTDRHWEDERSELLAHARLKIQTESVTGSGHAQQQPGHVSGRLRKLDSRYENLAAGGWRSLSETIADLPTFDQWKPSQPRAKHDNPGQSIKYEAPPRFPDGGGLLLPRVPLRCWRMICKAQGLPLPDDETADEGFWPWALSTPKLRLVICEGWKKALAAVSLGWAAVAVPGVQMGRRKTDSGERLIEALRLLAPDRQWVIAFDTERRPSTAAKVGAAAGALARALRAAGGRAEIARLPLLPGADKTGLDDLIAADPSAAQRALAATGAHPVLPRLRDADRVAPAGTWLSESCPIPPAAQARLVILAAPMGCGKTVAIEAHLGAPLASGTPVLLPTHRVALGQAFAAQVGVPWRPLPGSPLRQQGIAGCLDSWHPGSSLSFNPGGWLGAIVTVDEWAQALEHLLLSTGTELANHRAAVLRAMARMFATAAQVIAADAQMPEYAVTLLERLTGTRAFTIASANRPMDGRPLYCPTGFTNPKKAPEAFRSKWLELIDGGKSFLCWTGAQKANQNNAPQTLAKLHIERNPYHAGLIAVIDSSTPQLAEELAANPDAFAERHPIIYCSPSISSGISFKKWKPDAVIAYSGGHIAPEHVVQAIARVRSPQVPAYIFAPERAPGSSLMVGSGATTPKKLIQDLRASTNPLLGALEGGGEEWLQAWAEIGAIRNRARFAYRATIAGLLKREGWLLVTDDRPIDIAGAAAVSLELKAIAQAAQDDEDVNVLCAEPITRERAAELGKRRKLEPSEQAELRRWRLCQRWPLREGEGPDQDLMEMDHDGSGKRLMLAFMLGNPEALALVPERDQHRIDALDPLGQPFEPDRLRVALSPKIGALQALGVPDLLRRFGEGEVIPASDPAVVALHAKADACSAVVKTVLGFGPGKFPAGTLKSALEACGWTLERAGRVKARGGERDAYTYAATAKLLPECLDPDALANRWLSDLRSTGKVSVGAGARNALVLKPYKNDSSPSDQGVTAAPIAQIAVPDRDPPRRGAPLLPAVTFKWFRRPTRPKHASNPVDHG
jgi:hypothetical protein